MQNQITSENLEKYLMCIYHRPRLYIPCWIKSIYK